MFLSWFNLSLLESIILLAGFIILGGAVYFFYITRKSLRKTLEAYGKPLKPEPKRKSFKKILARGGTSARNTTDTTRIAPIHRAEPKSTFNLPTAPSSVSDLKETLLLQQQALTSLMQQVEELQGNTHSSQGFMEENEELQQRIEELELALMRKDQELHQAKEQEAIAQQLAARIDEVYKEFDLLQHKITTLEAQASRATGLNLELQDLQQAYQQLHKDLARKQHKIDEVVAENRRLRSELSLLEDKLSESNTQRQQLMKRAKYLEDAQTEIQSVTESQSKLQKELRRIGELESMLNMMAEERARGIDNK